MVYVDKWMKVHKHLLPKSQVRLGTSLKVEEIQRSKTSHEDHTL